MFRWCSYLFLFNILINELILYFVHGIIMTREEIEEKGIRKMRWRKQLIGLCSLFCICFLTGCSVRIPAFVPDDENVLALAKAAISDMDDILVSASGLMVYESDSGYLIQCYTNQYVGELSDVLCGTEQLETDIVDSIESDTLSFTTWEPSDAVSVSNLTWYLDTKKDAYYQKQDAEKWTGYTFGTQILDIDWWQEQLENFKYGGKSDGDLLLEATYSGTDLEKLYQHMGVSLQADFSASDVNVTLYLDRWFGTLKQIQIQLSDTGSRMQTVIDDVSYQVMNSTFLFEVAKQSDVLVRTEEVLIPDDALEVELAEPSSGMLRANTQVISEKQGLSLGNLYYVNVEPTESFDEISYDTETYQIHVSSSSELDGQPEMTISLLDGVDAYSYAKTDLSEFDEIKIT